ncbi:hypothetical protein BC829DRAFT_61765 [Chytridium lagenaria]|nr:hypothetical protein BC829DRAFT_61765 [Chytridium lagenaria]
MRTRSISNPTPGGLFKTKEPSANLVSVDTTIHSSNNLDGGSNNTIDSSSHVSISAAGDVITSAASASKEKNIMGMRKRASSSTAASPSKQQDPSLLLGSSTASISSTGSSGRQPRANKLFLHARSFYNGSNGPSSPSSDIGGSPSPGTPSSIASGFFSLAGSATRTSQTNSIQHQPRMSHGNSVLHQPKQMTFAEFKLLDVRPRKQRHVLHSLIVNDIKVRMEEKIEEVRDLRKAFKEPKFKEEKKGLGKLGGLLQKKKKKKTRAALFHLIQLAIHDQRTSQACNFLEELSTATLRKKQPIQANRVFLTAMANSMEAVCMVMLEKGFPVSINTPFFTAAGNVANGQQPTKRASSALAAVAAASLAGSSGNSSSSLGNKAVPMSTVDYPSYFMAAIGLGLDNVVRTMIKRSDVNQTWHGLSPLHIAASRNSIMIVNLLLENGADPNRSIYLSQYALLRRFKSYGPSPQSLHSNSASAVGVNNALRYAGLSGCTVPRQHPAGLDAGWVPESVSAMTAGSVSVAPSSVTVIGAVDLIDGRSSMSGSMTDGTEAPLDGKKSESPMSVESGLKPPSLVTTTAQSNTRDTLSSRGSRAGKLTRFSDNYLKGKKVYAVELAAAAGHSESVQALVTRFERFRIPQI